MYGALFLPYLLAAILVSGIIVAAFSHLAFAANTTTTPYAKVGAFASYSALGGFIPFFSGVNGTFEYNVTNIFPNDTMSVILSANVSQGNELPTDQLNYSYLDNLSVPRVFPALPLSELSARTIEFENTSCTFSKQEQISVPAGVYQTVEFVGTGPNGSKNFFWFDKSSGLAVQMVTGGGAFQLIQSNVAVPVSVPTPASESMPFIEAFAVAFAVAGLLFYGVWSHYRKRSKAEREGVENHRAEQRGKEIGRGRNKKKLSSVPEVLEVRQDPRVIPGHIGEGVPRGESGPSL